MYLTLNSIKKLCREIGESLGLQQRFYHVGIRRDPGDSPIWRRVGDGQVVEFSSDSWNKNNGPSSQPDRIYAHWRYLAGYSDLSDKLVIHLDYPQFFICEY